MRKLVPLLALALVGCGVNPGKTPDPVEINGRVTMAGKPVGDLTLNLQPTGTEGTQATIPLKNGEFRRQVTPGRYTFYLSEGPKTAAAAFRAIPEKFRAGSMDRQIDIGQQPTVEFTLE
jgi:hypothetical protein